MQRGNYANHHNKKKIIINTASRSQIFLFILQTLFSFGRHIGGGGNRTEAVLVGVEAHEEGGRRTTAVFQRSNYLSIYLLDL